MQLQSTVSRLLQPRGFQLGSASFSIQRERRAIFPPAARNNLCRDRVIEIRARMIDANFHIVTPATSLGPIGAAGPDAGRPLPAERCSKDLVHRPPAAANWASLRGHSTSSFTGGVRFETGAAVATVAIVSSMVVHRCPLAAHRAPYSKSGRIVDARKSAELYLG